MGSGANADAIGKVFDGRLPEKRPRFDSEPAPLWEDLQPDVLSVVLRFLPYKADRSRLRSVCRKWRAAASGHAVPPPLPLLVLRRFRFSSLSHRGALTAPRSAWMPPEMAGYRISCVRSFGDWLVGASQAYGGECFLMNAFSHKLINLPCLSDSGNPCFMYSLDKVELSASPDSESECIVAAYGYRRTNPEFSLWRPGMKSWHVCRHAMIGGNIDTAFYQGKLYQVWRFVPYLFALELRTDEHGVSVTRVEDYLMESRLPKPLENDDLMSCNIVVWHGKLLLIIRYYGSLRKRNSILKVEVLALDFNTKPFSVTEIRDLGTDCIFVGSGGCKTFPAGLHDGFEGGLIYFVPDECNPRVAFVYNMRDGAVRSFVYESHGISEDNLGFPVWLFPTE